MQEEFLKKGLAREDLARLLSACYYQPGPEFGEENVFGAIIRASALVHPELEQTALRLQHAFATESHDHLILDYSRLFLGPFDIRAKPYGSVWLEGEKVVMGDSTMAVRDLYQEGGFELAEDFLEVPDHIAAELEFLYLLIFKANEARRAGDAPALLAIIDLKRRFLREHLGKWLGPFTGAVRQWAQTDFYFQLAALSEAFVLAEQADAERSC
jgi:TorA maturation chaperone TorD